jgi:hypothetical protein
MTLSGATTHIRELSRTSSDGYSDTRVMEIINQAMNTFAIDTCSAGLKKEDYLTITPRFNTETNFAIRVTITGGTNALAVTDVAITTTARTDISGTTVASDLQATLRTAIGGGANLTVIWSTTSWTFTIDTINGTAITIASPSGKTYVDATELILGGASTGTQTLTSNFPQDCTIETPLPDDFLSIIAVEWDDEHLKPAPHDHFTSPESFGTPEYYNIQEKKIYLSPVPDRQESFHIWYKYQPAVFTDASTQATTELPIDAAYQMAIVFWASSFIAECNHEAKESDRCLSRYEYLKNKYNIIQANNNPKMYPKQSAERPIDIDFSTL